jgi:hydroxyacylglutathione hydrolase
MNVYLKTLAVGPMENFVYVIGDPETKEAAVVDPAWDVPAVLKELKANGYRLTHILLTHGHYDHTNGVEELVQQTGATVCAEKKELELLAKNLGGLAMPSLSLKETDTTDSVRVGKLEFKMIPTPGHTPGARCIHLPSAGRGALFTGDTLFVGTIGRCDLPYSSPEDLFRSVSRIKQLDDETVLYPGHDYGSTPNNTLGHEKKANPFLMVERLEDFLRLVHR